jgi:hypothetical protein
MQEPAQRFILNMDTNTVLPKATEPTADEKVDKIYRLLHDSRMWLAQSNVDNAKEQLAAAETLVLDLRHGPSLDNTLLKEYVRQGYHSDHDVNDWVEVILGQGIVLKEACITAVKFSQGGHVHFDLVYVTHTDDNGEKNYQKLYHVPTGLINAVGVTKECPDCGADLQVNKETGDLKFIKHNT